MTPFPLASGAADGSLILWDARKWTLKDRLAQHRSKVSALRFSSNNEFLASGSEDSLRIWDLSDPLHRFDTLAGPARAIWYYKGNPTTTGDPKPKYHSFDARGVRTWQPAQFFVTREEAGSFRYHVEGPWRNHLAVSLERSPLAEVCFALEGPFAAAGSTNGIMKLWNVNTFDRARVQACAGPLAVLAFSLGGTNIASGGSAAEIKVWDVAVLMREYGVPSQARTQDKP